MARPSSRHEQPVTDRVDQTADGEVTTTARNTETTNGGSVGGCRARRGRT
jgi:hypothetical protein